MHVFHLSRPCITKTGLPTPRIIRVVNVLYTLLVLLTLKIVVQNLMISVMLPYVYMLLSFIPCVILPIYLYSWFLCFSPLYILPSSPTLTDPILPIQLILCSFYSDLANANLSGELIPEMGQLKKLQYLYVSIYTLFVIVCHVDISLVSLILHVLDNVRELYSNNIHGSIPTEVGDLSELVSLSLYSNHLTGPLPASLGNLQNLRFL